MSDPLQLDLGSVVGPDAFTVWCSKQDPALDPGLGASWDAYLAAIKGETGATGAPGADGLTQEQVDARIAAAVGVSVQAQLAFDAAPTDASENPVKSGGVFTALAGKQAALTFDATPTDSSSNPVTSGGVHAAIAAASIGDTGWVELTKNAAVVTAGGIYYRVKNGVLYLSGNFTYSHSSSGIFITTTGIPEASLPPAVYGSSQIQITARNGQFYLGSIVIDRATGKLLATNPVYNIYSGAYLGSTTSVLLLLAHNAFVL